MIAAASPALFICPHCGKSHGGRPTDHGRAVPNDAWRIQDSERAAHANGPAIHVSLASAVLAVAHGNASVQHFGMVTIRGLATRPTGPAGTRMRVCPKPVVT